MGEAEQKLDTLEQISQILSENLPLEQAFQRVMARLCESLGLNRAALVLLDPAANQLRTVAAVGLTEAERQRGRYALGEGVTGQVLATGEPAVIPDLAQHPDFLNRTGARKMEEEKDQAEERDQATEGTRDQGDEKEGRGQGGREQGGRLSFLCVPIREGRQNVGAISADLPFTDPSTLQDAARMLRIIAGSIAQSVRIHNQAQVEKEHWLREREQLQDNLRVKYKFDNIIGSAPAMLDVLGTIGQVASSRATCLLLGETGCGKELIAKALHYNSPRRDHPMVRVNCGALSPQLLESELFGHIKGAFTGAVKDKIGRFEAAHGGTLFLDEVGTLDPQLQIKLLRVLQEREFERVGDNHTRQVDTRVIAATNLDLEDEARKGNFREDLYYRLNVVTIHLPPLRARREDIPRLIDHFLDRYNRENQRELRTISRDVMATLLRYPWPGNVRELENAVERAVVLSTSPQFTEDLLPLQIRMFARQTRSDGADQSIEAVTARLAELALQQYAADEGRVYDLVIHDVERQLLRQALDHHDGVKIRTADFLGINRNTLNKKVHTLGLPTGS